MTTHPVAMAPSPDADIVLVLEGTFPYVSGGVSSWINEILQAYPEFRFAIVFLGGRREDYGDFKYPLPPNVVHFEAHFLFDDLSHPGRPVARQGDPAAFAQVAEFIDALRQGDSGRARALELLRSLARDIMPGGRLQQEDFLYSERAWALLCDAYRRDCTDPSFVDYFWTVRIILQPLWLLARIAHHLLPVRVVHCASTGYAGFLGALLSETRALPMILTEHGIYTKERQIDLLKSEWIRDNRNVFQRDPFELSYFRQLWIQFFEWLGRYAYAAADPIIALYDTNRRRQIQDGADPVRTGNIPNGISLSRFAPLRAQRPADTPPVLCLIGRVVPIKDIKTFIRAMRRVVNQLPQAQGWIAGPDDEDPQYAQECRSLVHSLGLQDHVRFLGFQKVEQLLPQVGLVVLSSISEGLPLVILEGYAAGVPAVSTDVGACRQLIEGLDPVDQAIGASGRVVNIADPQALADAALGLLQDPAAWQQASAAAVTRVERYYADTLMFDRYRKVYESALSSQEEPR